MTEAIKKEITPPVEEDKRKQLPEPKGWKILVAMPQADEKTDGGIEMKRYLISVVML